jgi:hypothetical protein
MIFQKRLYEICPGLGGSARLYFVEAPITNTPDG